MGCCRVFRSPCHVDVGDVAVVVNDIAVVCRRIRSGSVMMVRMQIVRFLRIHKCRTSRTNAGSKMLRRMPVVVVADVVVVGVART